MTWDMNRSPDYERMMQSEATMEDEIVCFEQWHEQSLQKQWELYKEKKTKIKQLQEENEVLHHEISYYESLANNDPDADWPHRDRRYRDWLIKQLAIARKTA